MTRPYIIAAEGNLKGGCNVTLGPKTLIVGPNGSGKSTIANTVELATTGRVSDLVGRREVAKEVDLMALAPSRKGELLARVALSDGTECLWRAGGKSKKAVHKYPETIVVPDLVLPLRPVYDAVMGSVETARKFFLQYAVGAIADKDVLDRIPTALHGHYKRATLATSLSTSSAVDRLLAALEASKKHAREAKAQAKAAEGVSNDAAQGLAPLPVESDEKALRDALREAEGRREALRAIVSKREALAGAREEEATLATRLAAAEQDALAAQAMTQQAVDRLNAAPAPQAVDPLVVAFRAVLKAHVEKGLAGCECCGQMADNRIFVQRLVGFDAHFAQHAEAVKAYEAALAAHATATIREQQAMSAGKALWERAKSVMALLAESPGEAPSEAEIAAAEQQVTLLTEKLRAVDGLKAAWSVASRARDGVGEAKKSAEEWIKLAEACGEAVVSLLDTGVVNFVAKVQAGLPSVDKFALTLRDGERAVFQFGLLHQNVLHTAMSGAEWARVTAAMAAACVASPTHLSVVIPEERAFDPSMLGHVLASFSGLDSQVIFTSPVMPTIIPDGWTVIDTTPAAP